MRRRWLKGFLQLLILGVIVTLGTSTVYGKRGKGKQYAQDEASRRSQQGRHHARGQDDVMQALQRAGSGQTKREQQALPPRMRAVSPLELAPPENPLKAGVHVTPLKLPPLRIIILLTLCAARASGEVYDFSTTNVSGVDSAQQPAAPPGWAFVEPQRVQEEPAEPKPRAIRAIERDLVDEYYKRGDFESAAELLKSLVSKGDSKALYKLGALYHRGEGVPYDLKEAERLWKKAAEKGNIEAMADLAALYMGRGEYQKALEYFVKAVEYDNPEAQSNLAMIYYDGLGGTPKNPQEAVELWTKAAKAANLNAQTKLGFLAAEKGDYEVAKGWWTKAAEAGHPGAQRNLGSYYYHEEKNLAEAEKWLRKAADQGNIEAQNKLGFLYAVEKEDEKEAKRWWKKAADQGDPTAARNLEKLEQEQKERDARAVRPI